MFYFLLVHVKKVMKFIYLLSEIFTHVYMIDFTEQQIYLLVMSKGIGCVPCPHRHQTGCSNYQYSYETKAILVTLTLPKRETNKIIHAYPQNSFDLG